MVILSYEFAFCFVLFFGLYWGFYRSVRTQNALLIAAGLAFIASWSWQFLLSLLFVWAVSQFFALSVRHFGQKAWVFVLCLVLLVGHLAFFKYTNFAIGTLNERWTKFNPLDIVQPLGISFYTFQAIAYVADVYKKRIEPMPSAVFLGFLSFVPTLVAGPIFRPTDAKSQWVLPQSNEPKSHYVRSIGDPHLALALIMAALVKKILLAGWLESLWVTPIFGNPMQFNGLEVLTGIYAYSWQLFFDFSGYSDLVMGLGLLLGFGLPKNFNQPYLSTDIQDFWMRWHMSLSSWIKDYIYIPLGGNRGGFWRVQCNLMAAFLLSGIWHGAGFNFLIWGAIHGVALVWLNFMKRFGVRGFLTRHCKVLACFLTFQYVAFGWVFFRSETLSQAKEVLVALTHFDEPFALSIGLSLPLMLLGWAVYPVLKDSEYKVALWLSCLYWWVLPLVLVGFVWLVFWLAPEGLPGFIYANF